MKLIIFLLCTFSLLVASSYTQGRNIYYQKGCANCHGTQAEGSGTYPRLANKRKSFIVRKLNEFKQGKATSQTAEMMFSFANSLSYEDVKNISIFLSDFRKDTSAKYKISDDILGSAD